jgi:hypothetical protein
MQAEAEAPPAVSVLEGYEGLSAEVGGKPWDPLGFGELVGPGTMAWFRHAELKHGRVAMAAFVGFLVQVTGTHFPGSLDLEGTVSFASLSKLGFIEAWYGIPEKGRLQIIFLIGLAEWCTEATGPKGHYTKEGTPGDLTFIKPLGIPIVGPGWMPADKMSEFELAELKHGRLAMIGIMSVFSAMAIPGSVPALTGLL